MFKICSFRTSLHHKYNTASDYNTLVADIDQVNGGDRLQPDREAEWQTTQVTKCMLSEVINSGDITDLALTNCENDVNFALEVGVLDRKPTEFDKDHASRKSNQQNLGTILFSNLCTEITEYTSAEEAFREVVWEATEFRDARRRHSLRGRPWRRGF